MTTRRVLLDENLPVRLRTWLTGIDAVTVEFMGWKSITNGDLVRKAQAEGFTMLVTADRLLAATPRSWSPLGCVYVTSNHTPLCARLPIASPPHAGPSSPGSCFVYRSDP